MTTQQKQIRLAMEAAILAATGITPLKAPRRELGSQDMPAIALFGHDDRPLDDEYDHQGPHPRIYTVRVEVCVEELVEDDATDDLAAQIRQAVLHDDSLGGLCDRILWSAQQWDGAEGEEPMSRTALDFQVHYRWRPEWTLS